MRLEDPRISEAHALVSLRGSALKLLALRGVLAVGGVRVSEVVLEAGVRVELVSGLPLEVVAVTLPDSTLALDLGTGSAPQVLSASVHSILPGPVVIPRHLPDAPIHLWTTGAGWTVQPAGSDPFPLVEGTRMVVGDHEVVAITVAGEVASNPETRLRGRLHPPIRLVARYDTVQIHREGQPLVVFGGTAARLVSELVAMGGLASWEAIASEIWPEDLDRTVRRQRWDRTLQTLRSKLQQGRLRPDLIRADGKGNLELVVLADDTVIDET